GSSGLLAGFDHWFPGVVANQPRCTVLLVDGGRSTTVTGHQHSWCRRARSPTRHQMAKRGWERPEYWPKERSLGGQAQRSHVPGFTRVPGQHLHRTRAGDGVGDQADARLELPEGSHYLVVRAHW